MLARARPPPRSRRLRIVAVQALKVVRVITLFYLGQWNKMVFEFAHLYRWLGLIMLDVLIVWVLWARSAAPVTLQGAAT